MNSLSTSITEILKNWNSFSETADNIFSPNASFPVRIEGISGSLFSFFISELSKKNHFRAMQSIQYGAANPHKFMSFSSDIVVVVPTEREAHDIQQDLSSVFPEAELYVMPGFGVMPYRPVPKGSVIFGERTGFLARLSQKNENINFSKTPTPRIFIMTEQVFLSPIAPSDYIQKNCFTLKIGSKIDTIDITKKLSKMGYERVPRVMVKGEFSLRGEVLDIFLPCDEYPTRFIFDFDEIEAIKEFETDAQTTVNNKKDNVLIYPMREIIWEDEFIQKVKKRLGEYQKNSLSSDSTVEDLSTKDSVHLPFSDAALAQIEKMFSELETSGCSEGEEFFYSLIWDKNYSIFDYIDKSALVLFSDYDRMVNGELALKREYNAMYRKTRIEQASLPPDTIMQNFSDMLEKFSRCIFFCTLSMGDTLENDSNSEIELVKTTENQNIKINSEPGRSFFGNINYLKEEFEKLLSADWKIFIYTDNKNQTLRINEILKDFTTPQTENEHKFMPVQLIPLPISSGFSIPEIKLLVIQENEIFGRRKYVPKSLSKAKSQVIDTFVELNPGDFVVHVNWGIGRFCGIERIKSMGNERDYIKLEYADEEFAFVPIEQVNLVQRYIGSESEKPKLDRIGSKAWENRKNKVKQSVEDLAEKLIALYSRRKALQGFAFPHETEWQAAFEAAFPYEDTPDQITVTEEIKADMEKPVPMDRLICGDVGYGKTEIAMRAAFKAVMGGRQVAFLAPTTILAEQHYETCVERFVNFPVKIAQLSRFVSHSEQKKILAKLQNGEIDILIGTHRIIQKDVIFKNLGLMIVDEEQRFGVKDKEKLKELKNNIDCLAMSATPIPRTLHMSLLKIRDMSLLTTPPQNRIPIETFVDSYSDDKIVRAIRREIEREGQIFYLHNRVETLLEVRAKIERLVPEVLVDVAHGQMSSDELDDIFHRFKNGGFHVLIATTIIENGIDIPNVNTIIIDRADMYGVSQLYQLRGRVGRADRKAYAYLLYPENKSLSEVAMKRLQVISDFTELGSGFKIAMKDMEIRGAGNLLGKDQSGEVYAVGFDLYMRLLNDAVNRLTAQKEFDEMQNEVLMEMEYTGFIPDSYVQNPQVKMEIYKKIASVTTNAEFEAVLSELDDRFGPIPDEVSSLLALAEIRIICKKLKIASIKEKQGELSVEFRKVSDISVDKILSLIAENPKDIKLNSSKPNFIFIKLGSIGLKEKSEYIREKLSKLIA